MSATIDLLDKFKAARGIKTDTAAADALRVGKAAVSKWRNGGGHPDADSVEAMCKAVGEPLRQWLPLIEAERARTPAARQVWIRLAQAAAALALAVGLSPAHAEKGIAPANSAQSTPVYIMRNFGWVARIAGTVRAWFSALLPHGSRECPAHG